MFLKLIAQHLLVLWFRKVVKPQDYNSSRILFVFVLILKGDMLIHWMIEAVLSAQSYATILVFRPFAWDNNRFLIFLLATDGFVVRSRDFKQQWFINNVFINILIIWQIRIFPQYLFHLMRMKSSQRNECKNVTASRATWH